MFPVPRFFRLSYCVGLLSVFAVEARGAVKVDPGHPGFMVTVPSWPEAVASPGIVDARPAIAYVDDRHLAIRFVRALDATGEAWGAPMIVANGPEVGGQVTLLIVNGNPAICYFDFRSRMLRFVRALDAQGGTWGAPVDVAAGAVHPASADVSPDCGVEIIEGKPAVCFTQAGTGTVNMVRAADDNGGTWGAPAVIDDGSYFRYASLSVVQGRPAVAYGDSATLWYRRALDTTGAAWGDPVQAGTLWNSFSASVPRLTLVNGHPAFGYVQLPDALQYHRAGDAEGTAWDAGMRIDTGHRGDRYASLAVVNGKPAIAFTFQAFSDTCQLWYVEATDAAGAGSTAWRRAVSIDVGESSGLNCALFEVQGRPAIVHRRRYDGSLIYTRSIGTGTDGGALWPAEPVLSIRSPQRWLPHGGTHDFGAVAVGENAIVPLSFSNPATGSPPLTDLTVSLAGPDAADFVIITAPAATTVAPGASVPFDVEYAPLSAGNKTATLRMAATAAGSSIAYEITLKGNSLPDLRLERVAGTHPIIPDGAALHFPLTIPGDASYAYFQIRNTGHAPVENLAVTIDGPDSSAFAVVQQPRPVLPPGDEPAALVIALRPQTSGPKSATAHISSNVPGKNPLHLPLAAVPGMLSRLPFAAVNLQDPACLALDADGKLVLGKNDGHELTRLHPDFSLDLTFFPPSFDDGRVWCLAMQPDGKILAAGDFEEAGGMPRKGLVRLLPDGSLDHAFAPGLNGTAYCVTVLPDGGILAGGAFTKAGGQSWPHLARFHPDGTLDTTFTTRPNSDVRCLALQRDGKIVIGGAFDTVSSWSTKHLARLHADGRPDESFSAVDPDIVSHLAMLPDGGMVAAWEWENGLAWFQPDGKRNAALSPSLDGEVTGIVVQADGQCIITGDFQTIGGVMHPGLARFRADGTLDAAFGPDVEERVRCAAIGADGSVFVAGGFTVLGGISRRGIAKLINDINDTRLIAENHSTVRWLNSGAAPALRDVTFDYQPFNGTEWTRLGAGTRTANGWELQGLTLPYSGYIRARGFSQNSFLGTESSLTPPLETWRLLHFQTAENTGDAANEADPDHDGLTNLIEFAFGLSPVDRTSSQLPEFTFLFNEMLSAQFTPPPGLRDVIEYTAQWSSTMLEGTWEDVPDSGINGTHEYYIGGFGTGRYFGRFKVRLR